MTNTHLNQVRPVFVQVGARRLPGLSLSHRTSQRGEQTLLSLDGHLMWVCDLRVSDRPASDVPATA